MKPCIVMYSALLSATGGAQYTMSLFAQELARRGYRNVFFTRPPFDPDHRYSRMLARAGVSVVVLRRLVESGVARLAIRAAGVLLVIPYAVGRARSFRNAWQAAQSIAETFVARAENRYIRARFGQVLRRSRREHRSVILHIWGPAALTPFLLEWAKANDVPSIYHEMGEADEAYVRMFSMEETVRAINLADRVVCVSPSVSDTLRRVFDYRGRIVSIYDMVTDPGESWVRGTKRGGRVTFGAIGRLVPHKRHNELIRAIRELADRGYDAALVIASDGPQRQPLEQLARELGVSDRVMFTGEFEDLNAVMAQFDIFVLSSSSESQCMPATESMAYGKPVIVSRFGGMPDFVEDGVTGLLVTVGDFDGLVEAMRRLIDDPGLREQMGAQARRRFVALFAPAKVGDMAERLYADLLPSTAASTPMADRVEAC